ncbi:unnamed protein product [Rhizoctonia solani]|uniref:Nephrocystin 3-like N-terminal domain-containing protein n=1 Tax=Rhizoctonia solani TaxID=456999 RepID=A0A8H3CW89_9AGAM|nr:unnamed protein product [Rhizoctonia solani]
MANNNLPDPYQWGGYPSTPANARPISPIPRLAVNRSASRPTTPGATMSQGQSSSGLYVGYGQGLLSVGSNSIPNSRSPSPSGAGTRRSRGFPSLAALQTVLDKGATSFGPLKAAINDFADCIGSFERATSTKEEYKKLEEELNEIYQGLQQHCGGNAPPLMTSCVENLCNGIQKEVRGIQEKLKRRRLTRMKEASGDPEDIMRCYNRVRDHISRISLNAKMSTWRILDQSITDNRLRNMSPALSACYNSAQAPELKRGPCTASTRIELLAQLHGWINNPSLGSVYWMSGMAGTGKTTIAYSLCEELDFVSRLGASFFCSRTLPACRDVNLIIPTIAYQLARSSYPFRCALSDVLEKSPDAHTRLLCLQFDALIGQPLLQVADALPQNLVVIIDALDECENKKSTGQILDVLLTRALGLPVKFIVSSRPEPEIREEMTKHSEKTKSRVVLHELDRDGVQADIERYLRAALARVQPNEDEIAALVQRTGVLFIYAATVVRYIGHNNFRNYRARLDNVLKSSGEKQNEEIDKLYSAILEAALEDPHLESTEINDIRMVLYTVICAQEPLTIDSILQFLRMDDAARVRTALEPLSSVLHVSGPSELVTTLHASFPDYMLDSSRSRQYNCNPLVHNQTLALRCFDYFRDMRPQFNICNLGSSFVPDDKVGGLDERVKNCISDVVFYAGRYWAWHLCSAERSLNLIEELEELLSVRLLLWMEVMNLKRCKGSMPGIIRLVEKNDMGYSATLRELIRDAMRFVTTFSSSPVSSSTPHIYTSMLPFWPKSSLISNRYAKYTKGMIELEGIAVCRLQRALLAVWGYCDLTSPTFSPDGSQIAARKGNTVVLLNALTGQMESPFKGYYFEGGRNNWHPGRSVQFSPNGTLIVSAAKHDHSGYCIWNVHSKKLISWGEIGPINCFAFSPDETRIAFGLRDEAVKVLDIYKEGEPISLCTELDSEPITLDFADVPDLNGLGPTGLWGTDYLAEIRAVEYSPDGLYLLACDDLGNIIKWDGKGRQALKTRCQLEEDCFAPLDISPDCTHLAASGYQSNIYIWKLETGQPAPGIPNLVLVDPHLQNITSLSYSPDGLCIVSGTTDSTICLWDTQTDDLLHCFLEINQTDISIESVAFSPDGAYIVSKAGVGSIHLWDARSRQAAYDQLPGHTRGVTSVGFSPDGQRIVSGADDCNVYVWDAESGRMVLKLIRPAKDSWDSINLASYSPDGTQIIILLKSKHEDYARTSLLSDSVLYPSHHSGSFTPVALSEGSTKLLSVLSAHSVQSLVSNNTDTVLFIHPPITGSFDHVTAAVRSGNRGLWFDNQYLFPVSVLRKYEYLTIHDAHSGHLLSDLDGGQYIDSRLIQFSPDGVEMARGQGSKCVIFDVRGESVVRVLGPLKPDHADHRHITSIHWSPDGTHIAALTMGAGAVRLCNARTGQQVLGPGIWHTEFIESMSFSPDSTRVVSGSRDKAIRVTDVRTWANIVSDCSTPTGSDWKLNEDGWAVDDQGHLLMWVPLEMRTVLMYPRTKLLISRDGWLRMNFSSARLGESWNECYKPD